MRIDLYRNGQELRAAAPVLFDKSVGAVTVKVHEANAEENVQALRFYTDESDVYSVDITDGAARVPHEVIKTPGFTIAAAYYRADGENIEKFVPTEGVFIPVMKNGYGEPDDAVEGENAAPSVLAQLLEKIAGYTAHREASVIDHPDASVTAAKIAAGSIGREKLTSALAAELDEKAKAAEVYTKTEADAELAKKVDKESGKGLSANDYTDEEKAKLADLPESVGLANAIGALETDIEGKVDKESGKGLSDAASVSVYHADAGNEVLQIVGQDGATKLTPFYGKQAVDDKVSALSLGLSEKVDKVSGKGLSTVDDVSVSELGGGDITVLYDIDFEFCNGVKHTVSTYSTDAVDRYLGDKVDKESGKGLSANDYTAEEKAKLAELPESGVLEERFGKADSALELLKEQSVPHSEVSDYPVTLTDALAGEGFRTLKVYGGCGKNLVNIAGRTIVSNWAFANTSQRVLTGNQIIKGYAASNYAIPANVTISEVTDESISIVSQSNAYGVGLDVEICPNTEYHISGNSGNIGRIMVGLYDKDGNFLKTLGGIDNFTFTTPENAKWAVLALTATATTEGSVGSPITFSEIQLELGTTATAWEAYKQVGDADGDAYKIPVRVCGKNLFDSEWLLQASGWTCEDGIYKGSSEKLYIKFNPGFHIPSPEITYAISFEAKNAARTTSTTYFRVEYTDGTSQNIGVFTSTQWAKYAGVTQTGKTISKIMPGLNYDDTVYLRNIQIEAASEPTDYEPYSSSSATATLDTQLTDGEYIDVINKKRYSSDGTQTDITVTGELKTVNSESLTVDCMTEVSPPKIDAEYWQDINKVIAEMKKGGEQS